jgi:hypothetical protein
VTGLEAESWKDSAPVQGIGGFIGGVALGLAPGAGLGERVLSAGGVLAPGTRAANIGKAFGEMVGGVALMFFGGGGTAAGIGVSATGIGAAVGVPAVAVSAGLATAGAANAAAGFQGLLVALMSGGGSGSGPMDKHHTIPREIRAPRSGKPGKLKPDVANHPDVKGRPGLPNRWDIPRELHQKLHPQYNRRFEAELAKIKGEPTAEDVIKIRDQLATEFGIEGYRP